MEERQQLQAVYVEYVENRQSAQTFRESAVGQCFFWTLEVIPTILVIVALILEYNNPCSVPLQIFLMVDIVPSITWRLVTKAHERYLDSSLTNGINGLSSWGETMLRRYRTTTRIGMIIALFEMSWIFVGVYWLSKGQSCAQTAPWLFWMSFVDVLISGAFLFLVFVFICLVCCVLCCCGNNQLAELVGAEIDPDTGIINLNIQNPTPPEVLDNLPTRRYRAKVKKGSGGRASDSDDPREDEPLVQKDDAAYGSVSQQHVVAVAGDETETNDEARGRRGSVISQLIRSSSSRILGVRFDEVVDEQSTDTCSICLTEFEEGEELKTLPCRHEFHKDCIDDWLHRQRTCPLCRHDVTVPMV